jgi:hypothetical protein
MDASNGERMKLRAERDRLAMERAALKAEVARLAESHDVDALRGLNARLHRYAEALHEYHQALEAFHQRFGPLDPHGPSRTPGSD